MDDQNQNEVIAFLGRASSYACGSDRVEVVATHASLVFLVGDRAYKLKRAVRYSYLDYTTTELRRRACETEVALNCRTAPSLYLGVMPVTRSSEGRLALGGRGEALDWVVVMRRLAKSDLLDHLAATGRLTPQLVIELAGHIVDFHAHAEHRSESGGTDAFTALIAGNDANLRSADAALPAAAIDKLHEGARAALRALDDLLDRRRRDGYVRRCHGDLHLGNICLLEGKPVLFDAIEFSEEIATVDLLYDLALLLVDLEHHGLPALANLLFNRYLDLIDAGNGLAALPLFLSTRAAIRAHVTGTAVRVEPDPPRRAKLRRTASAYLDLAIRYLAPSSPRLVAIGGLSGSGKSTLAAALAPGLGRAPGARVLRSDVVRKRLFGVAPEARLPAAAYSPEMTRRVYESLGLAAREALTAGQSVVADAVFAQPQERLDIAAIAAALGTRFRGLWLDAPPALLASRLAARGLDASDATPAVLETQLTYDLGRIDWPQLDASANSTEVLTAARQALAA
ncbi:MAG TPA: AAA family ATPase [Stellaceae bacterium]|nr:AAA family ATPase [Stellaceae bacterium]